MKIEFENILHASQYRVFDCLGRILRDVVAYDTATKELTTRIASPDALAYSGTEDGRFLHALLPNGETAPAVVSFVLLGSFATDSEGTVVGD